MITNDIETARKGGVQIGNNTTITGPTNFGSEPYLVKLGNNVCVSFNVNFITHDNGTKVINYLLNDYSFAIYGPIEVGNNCFIGAGSSILPNVKIGNNVIIGACSVITKDIPDNVVAAGVPCRVISTIDEYIEKNKEKFLPIRRMSEEERRKFLVEKFWGI